MLKRRVSLPLAAALVISGSASLSAQEDRSTAIVGAMYDKLQKIFSPTKPGVPVTSYLTLANPGVRFDPNLAPQTNNDDEYLVSQFLDDALMPNPYYTKGQMRVSSVYEYIFAFKEQPDFHLSEADQKELQRLQDLLGPDSPKRQKYDDYMYKVLDAQDAMNAAAQPGGTGASSAKAKYTNATQDWATLGYKQEIESAREKYQELSAKDPGFWWNNLRTRMISQTKQTADGTSYYKTLTYPQYKDWGSDQGWTTYKLSDSEVEALKTQTTRDAGIKGGYNAGLWKVSASASYKSNNENAKTTVKSLSIEMQVKAVNIYRPWMEALVFKSRSWRFNPTTSSLNRVSEGDLAAYAGMSPTQLPMMPLVPVRMILAKGIKFKGQFSQEEKSLFERSIKTKASVSYGPFSVSGHYNQDDKRDYFSAKMSDAGIEAPDIQIIGFICDVVPKSPNPDPSLPGFKPAPIELKKKS